MHALQAGRVYPALPSRALPVLRTRQAPWAWVQAGLQGQRRWGLRSAEDTDAP